MLLLLFWYSMIGAFVIMPPIYAAAWVVALGVVFLAWFALRPTISRRRRATLRLRRPLGDMYLVWRAVPAEFLLNISLLLLATRFVAMPSDVDPISKFAVKPLGWLAVTIFVALVGPLIEEFVFRGFMQRKLERLYGAGIAIWITAVVFSIAHWQLGGFPSRVAAGLILGYLAYVTRSIWPGVLLHVLANAGAIALLLLPGDDSDLERAAKTWPVTLAAVAGVAISVAALRVLALRLQASVRRSRELRRRREGAQLTDM